MDRIQNYPDSFGSDLYPLPCKRGLYAVVAGLAQCRHTLATPKPHPNNRIFGKIKTEYINPQKFYRHYTMWKFCKAFL